MVQDILRAPQSVCTERMAGAWESGRRGTDLSCADGRSGRRWGPLALPLPWSFPMRLLTRGAVVVAMLATATVSGAQVPKNVDAAMNGFDAYIAKVMKDWDAP